MTAGTLTEAACAALATPEPARKAEAAAAMASARAEGGLGEIGRTLPPDRPARPDRPALRPPREMPRRGRAQSRAGRVALLHAIAHIELNAIDLACDLIARFAAAEPWPRAFFDDWARIAGEEARHFALLAGRLAELGAAYGDLPAHDGLWQSAARTAHDPLARLAVVPLVLEARGLDVTPAMIESLHAAGDGASAAVLQTIYDEEIGHVAVGRRWFTHLCARRGLAPAETWRALVARHFAGALKPPFNHEARARAGLGPEYTAPAPAE